MPGLCGKNGQVESDQRVLEGGDGAPGGVSAIARGLEARYRWPCRLTLWTRAWKAPDGSVGSLVNQTRT